MTDQYEGDPAERADHLDPADPDRAAPDATAGGEQAASGAPVDPDDPEEILIDAVLAGAEDDEPAA